MKKKLYIAILISVLTLTGCGTMQESVKSNSVDSGVNTQIIENAEIENTEFENTEFTEGLENKDAGNENVEIENTEIIADLENENTEIIVYPNSTKEGKDKGTDSSLETQFITNVENDTTLTTENHENSYSLKIPIDDTEAFTQKQSGIKTDSRGKDGENSLAYLETLHENISQAMVNGELPFVSSCQVDEAARTVKVGILEMKDEYIQKLKEFENMGPALDIFQQDFPAAE